MKRQRKLYIVSNSYNGKESINGEYLLVDDTGKALYNHNCSSIRYAKGDLITNVPDRLEECSKIYGYNFKILYLGEDEMTLDKLVELHNKNYENTK